MYNFPMIINYSYYRNRKVRVQFYLDYNKEVLASYLHVLYKYVTFSCSLFTFIIHVQLSRHAWELYIYIQYRCAISLIEKKIMCSFEPFPFSIANPNTRPQAADTARDVTVLVGVGRLSSPIGTSCRFRRLVMFGSLNNTVH